MGALKFRKACTFTSEYTLNPRINLTSQDMDQIPQGSESELPEDEVIELTMSLGMDAPVGSLFYLYGSKFAEEVNNLSNGKMKIDLYTDAKLGTDRQMLKNILNDGDIDFIIQTTPPQVDFMPKLSVFDMPMVHTNRADLSKTINNAKFYEKISNIYKNGGYKLLGLSNLYLRQFATNKEIQNIDDFNGIKIRTIQNKNYEGFWKSLGATIIPLPIGEIYTSIKNGFIDSQDNPIENMIVLKLYEVQKYFVNTNHLPQLINLITSDKFYNSLTSAEKAIIDEAAVNATANFSGKAEESFKAGVKTLVDNGMTVLELTDETKQAMRLKAQPVYERIHEVVDDDQLINLYIGNETLYS